MFKRFQLKELLVIVYSILFSIMGAESRAQVERGTGPLNSHEKIAQTLKEGKGVRMVFSGVEIRGEKIPVREISAHPLGDINVKEINEWPGSRTYTFDRMEDAQAFKERHPKGARLGIKRVAYGLLSKEGKLIQPQTKYEVIETSERERVTNARAIPAEEIDRILEQHISVLKEFAARPDAPKHIYAGADGYHVWVEWLKRYDAEEIRYVSALQEIMRAARLKGRTILSQVTTKTFPQKETKDRWMTTSIVVS